MYDQDDPDTLITFRAGVRRETVYELARAMGQDTRLPVVLNVIVTALGGLSRNSKADLIQFLQGADRPEQAPQGAPRCTCGVFTMTATTANGVPPKHSDYCPMGQPWNASDQDR
jgi:hypothetical protein